MQRLLKTRLFSDALSNVHFYGWQLLIVAAAIALVTGNTQAKEYARKLAPVGNHSRPSMLFARFPAHRSRHASCL